VAAFHPERFAWLNAAPELGSCAVGDGVTERHPTLQLATTPLPTTRPAIKALRLMVLRFLTMSIHRERDNRRRLIGCYRNRVTRF
jgi:hypothetical protein